MHSNCIDMAVNKSALIRYQFLDKCFSDFGRKFYFDELLEKLNEILLKEDPSSDGVRVRQLRDDIRFMKSEDGYNAPIIAYKDGRKAYYRYENKNFSIVQAPLNKDEIEQLEASFLVLQRFNGAKGCAWMQEIGPMLQNQFNLHGSGHTIMSIDQKNQGSNYIYIQTLLNAIVNHQVLDLTYAPLNESSKRIEFHPYFLKQHANEWFVFGRNEVTFDNKYHLPLNRIISISTSKNNYLQTKMDWEDYFKDIIGVTQTADPVQEILLKFQPEYASIVLSNPIHHSQKAMIKDDGSLEVNIKVKSNKELEMCILSYGDSVEVVFPVTLKYKILDRVKNLLEKT